MRKIRVISFTLMICFCLLFIEGCHYSHETEDATSDNTESTIDWDIHNDMTFNTSEECGSEVLFDVCNDRIVGEYEADGITLIYNVMIQNDTDRPLYLYRTNADQLKSIPTDFLGLTESQIDISYYIGVNYECTNATNEYINMLRDTFDSYRISSESYYDISGIIGSLMVTGDGTELIELRGELDGIPVGISTFYTGDIPFWIRGGEELVLTPANDLDSSQFSNNGQVLEVSLYRPDSSILEVITEYSDVVDIGEQLTGSIEPLLYLLHEQGKTYAYVYSAELCYIPSYSWNEYAGEINYNNVYFIPVWSIKFLEYDEEYNTMPGHLFLSVDEGLNIGMANDGFLNVVVG